MEQNKNMNYIIAKEQLVNFFLRGIYTFQEYQIRLIALNKTYNKETKS